MSYRTNRRTGKKYPIGYSRGLSREDILAHEEELEIRKAKALIQRKYARKRSGLHTQKRERGGVGSNTGRDITGRRSVRIFPDRFFPIGDENESRSTR